MLSYEMRHIDERKAQIIETLAGAPGAYREIPAIDRILIADLVIAGVKKMMDAMNAHLEMAAPSLHTETAERVMCIMQFMEIAMTAEALVRQMGLHSFNGMQMAMNHMGADDLAELQKTFGLDSLDPATRAMAEKRLKELGL